MYRGKIVEVGASEEITERPQTSIYPQPAGGDAGNIGFDVVLRFGSDYLPAFSAPKLLKLEGATVGPRRYLAGDTLLLTCSGGWRRWNNLRGWSRRWKSGIDLRRRGQDLQGTGNGNCAAGTERKFAELCVSSGAEDRRGRYLFPVPAVAAPHGANKRSRDFNGFAQVKAFQHF